MNRMWEWYVVPSVDAMDGYARKCLVRDNRWRLLRGDSLAAVRLGKTYWVVNAYASGENVVESSAYQLASYCGQVVSEYFAFKVVAFVLDYSCQKSGDFFIVFVEVFIKPLQTYVLDAFDVFGYAGKAETPLATADTLAIKYGYARIDKCHTAINAFWECISYGRGIYNNDAVGAAYLRCGQAYALAGIHGLEHIGHEFFQLGIIRRDVFALFAEHRLAQHIYR